MDSEEILDLVNDDDQVIGTLQRGDIRTLTPRGGKYVRVTNVFIIRGDGKLWVPVRSTKKSIAPGGLDYSVGGHVPSGESYAQATIRELKEEANLDIAASELKHIATFQPEQLVYFSRLYLLRSNVQPELSDEHTDGSWMQLDELETKLESGTSAKDELLPHLKLLKQYLDNDAQGLEITHAD